MRLHARTKIQLAVFGVVAVAAAAVMGFGYMKLPASFGVGRYTVTIELPQSAGLYASGNVTYRGVEVGSVKDVRLTPTGVEAVLSLRSGVDVPSDVKAEVHSQSAVGEQYVALIPRSDNSPPLRQGAVIPLKDTSVPPDINSLLEAANRGLDAIPQNNLKTVVDESYTAFGGLGPEISRLVKNSTTLAIDARKNLDSLTTVIDRSRPILDSQVDTADAVQSWAAHLANISGQLEAHDDSLAGLLKSGAAAAAQSQALFERLQPTLPIVLANLISVGGVGIAYRADVEQLLVLVPHAISILQALMVPNQNTGHSGAFLDFKLNLNLPPPCTTGYLPAAQQRAPALVDYPERTTDSLYCRIPQDSPFVVRGARNIPCETVAGKRAPTVKMCESNEQYVPLNDGMNWKGDPNATMSGQNIPQPPPAAQAPPAAAPGPAPPPIAVTQYDPTTGAYVAPDGRVYTQSDLAETAPKEKTWQSMLTPPGN